jgi:cellulose synthase/poly-beta-1,6-N-acetylglucosamine synthase-like glycosyltransferase
MNAIQGFILALNTLMLFALIVFGCHRLFLLYLFFRYRRRIPRPAGRFEKLPRVTIQLPLFNEVYVVSRLIDAVCAIRYPRDRLQIQVLDDSTDETRRVALRKVEEKRAEGFDIDYIHRTDRTGFKAGALENGLETATGEFVAVFDADFLPRADFLEKAIHFFVDEKIGLVQFRWEHLNRDYSRLTQVQSVFLDGHFIIESTSRNRSGRFVNFNGTAGMWRKRTIEEAGGWDHDTLTEDLDLSLRAQMKGWRFVYLMEETAPSEVPVEVNAFKTQQHRWAKGMTQVMRKMLPTIWRAPLSLKIKLEATFQLCGPLAYLPMTGLMLLTLPTLILRVRNPQLTGLLVIDALVFLLVTCSFVTFYIVAEREIDGDWKRPLRYVPLLAALGIGMAVNQTRAVLEALLGQESAFERTPKWGVAKRSDGWASKKYKGAAGLVPYLEIGLAGYFTVAFFVMLHYRLWISLPFTLVFMGGLFYTGIYSLMHLRQGRKAGPATAPATAVARPTA